MDDFLSQQEAFRRGLGFTRDGPGAGIDVVWIWDYLSLAALLGWVGEVGD